MALPTYSASTSGNADPAKDADEARGRVNAVNQVFVGASVGEFRAGTMAALIGTVPAGVVGGIGAVAAAGLWDVSVTGAAQGSAFEWSVLRGIVLILEMRYLSIF